MATITSLASGNWWTAGTWDLGRAPIDTDDVVFATGHTIVWDNAGLTIPATGTLNSITGQGTGAMTLALTIGVCVLNCTTIQAGTTSTVLTITGISANSLTVNATTLTGGTGGSGRGIRSSNAHVIILNITNLVGGTGYGSNAFVIDASGTYTVNCTTLTGGSGVNSSAIYNGGATTLTLSACNWISGTGSVAYLGKPPTTWTNTNNTNYIQITNTGRSNKFATEPNAGDLDDGVAAGSTTGTLVQPAIADVRSGTQYGAGGTEFTGTMSAAFAAPIITTNSGVNFSQTGETVTLAGTCNALTTIIRVNGSTTGVTFTALTTSWSYTSPAVTVAAHIFVVTALNAGGDESNPDQITVTRTATTDYTLAPEAATYKLLTDNATVNALIVDAVTGKYRMFPETAAQETKLPYICIFRVDAEHEHHMLGASGMVTARIQIDGYESTYAKSIALGTAIRNTLDGYRGVVTVGSNTLDIRQCFLKSDNTEFVAQDDSGGAMVRRISHDYAVVYPETPPTF